MTFSCKIVLSWRPKEDKTRMVQLQAIIDRQRAYVPLGFYLREEMFDARRQIVKPAHPNHKDYNKELIDAVAKANAIASKFRREERVLTPEAFRNEYNDPTEKMDVIKFMRTELAAKVVSKNTKRRHTTVINKLDEFRLMNKKKFGSFLAFQHLRPDVIQSYKQHLIREGNKITTVNKELATIKEYLKVAAKKEIKFKDPFIVVKIKTFKSTRMGLTQKEVDRLEAYYNSPNCDPSHKRLLQYFLFSCYTGLRISDIKRITWNDINDNIITKQLKKGEDFNPKQTIIPISKPAQRFLPEREKHSVNIFRPFAEQYSNRMLKDIMALDAVKINKKVTYHTSRHTFGSLFALGGDVTALKDIMGHGSIATTMGYVHKNPEDLISAVNARFGE